MDKKRLLLVDDDKGLLEGLELLFTSKGYEVRTATSPQQIDELIENVKPHLLIMDVLMPPFNGLEVCERLKTAGHQFPVMLLSATTIATGPIKKCQADAFATKPFIISELLENIRKLTHSVS